MGKIAFLKYAVLPLLVVVGCAQVDRPASVSLPPGAIIEVTLTTGGEAIFNGDRSRLPVEAFRYRQAVARRAGGYHIVQTLSDYGAASNGRPTSRVPVRVEFETDEQLRPTKYVGWAKVIAAGAKRVDALKMREPEMDIAAMQAGMDHLAALSPEQAAAEFLRDQRASSSGSTGEIGKCRRKFDRKTRLALRTTCVIERHFGERSQRFETLKIEQTLIAP